VAAPPRPLRARRSEFGSRSARSLISAALALALAATLALWDTRFHLVPIVGGRWQGISDPPSALRIAIAMAAAAGLAWVLRGAGRRSLPLLWLGLAAAPLVPVLTGRLDALLAVQGPFLTLVAAAALMVAIVSTLPPPPPLRARALFLIAFLFYALLATRLPGPAGPQGDEPHYLVMAHSLLTDQDLDLADEFAKREYSAFFAGALQPHTSPASPPGRVYPVHTPGLPVVLLPGYALAGYAGARLLMAALAALTAAVVYRLVREVSSSDAAATAVWALLTFTPPLPFYALALYPETPAALATALFLWIARSDPSPRRVVLAGILAAALPWLHPKLLPLAALGLLLVLLRRGKTGPRILALALLAGSLAALLHFFHELYGRYSLSAAYGPGFSSDVSLARVPRGAAGLIFDRQYGLLAVSPVWALALPGWAALWDRRPGDALRAAILGGATFVVGAAFSMWWGGACPPARFVVPALPALCLALLPAAAARPTLAAALGGIGLAVVAVAAETPRALHNRADGESALLRVLAPALDLDDSLPSFVIGGGMTAVLLALSLAAAGALVWLAGRRGFLAAAVAYALVAAGMRSRPLVDARAATLELLEVWQPDRLRGPPPDLHRLAVALDLPDAPWSLEALDLRNSRRLDLPPGLYELQLRGRVLEALRGAHVARLELTAGDIVLYSGYLREGAPVDRPRLALPVGARRLALTATGIQGRAVLDEAALRPEEVVPRRQRDELQWPRIAEPERYRVPFGPLRVTVLDRSFPESGGFRLEGDEGSFLVEVPAGRTIELRVQRGRPAAADAIRWAGRKVPLGALKDVVVELAPPEAPRLGGVLLAPLRLRAPGAWLAISAGGAEPEPTGPETGNRSPPPPATAPTSP
jgi:hypothetical protein